MARPLDPIVGPDGRRLWVATRDHIGAEEINAACEWTRRVTRALMLEHSQGGHHGRGFQPIGAVRMVMPEWKSGTVYEGHIYRDSFLLGQTEEKSPGTFKVVPLSPAQIGYFEIHMSPALPNTRYFAMVHGQPQPCPDGYRRFRFWPGSRTVYSFQIQAHGNPATFASRGTDRMPIVIAIYADRRP